MKKKFFSLIITVLLLTGCGGSTTENKTPDTETAHTMQEESGAKSEENKFPGSYTVPDGWIKSDEYSTDEKIFYVQEGHENDTLPDNISVNIGSNKYSADEHSKFKDAILSQLLFQLNGTEATLNGDGTYTKQGYTEYIFTIEDSDAVTKQYYIIDDYRYCLIHLTNYTLSENAYAAVQEIADSFVWQKDEDIEGGGKT